MQTINKIFARLARKRLRRIIAGYRILKDSGQLSLPVRLKGELSNVELESFRLHRACFNEDLNFELSARQYLVSRVLGLSFNKSILYSVGTKKPLSHPLPREWQLALEGEIEVDKLSCTFLWYVYAFLMWTRGFSYGVKSIFRMASRRKKKVLGGRCAYFHDISEYSVPSSSSQYNIVNWYISWKRKDIDLVVHNNKSISDYCYKEMTVCYVDDYPDLIVHGVQFYLFWFLYLSIQNLILIIFRPLNSILFEEILKAIRVKFASKHSVPIDCLFNNSSLIYRPFWTYYLRKDSKVLFYFYSTNIEGHGKLNRELSIRSRSLASWPYYLVWDQYQKDFVSQLSRSKAHIEISGPIWFSSIETNVNIPKGSVAVFDVTPFRPAWYVSLGLSSEYYTSHLSKQFLHDVHQVLQDLNKCMAHKTKRRNVFSHKKYVVDLKRLGKQAGYVEINPDIGALQLIRQTEACISMPFTSTAIIAKSEGKPSVYYDPGCLVQKEDRAAHGILVLNNKNELRQWLESVVHE